MVFVGGEKNCHGGDQEGGHLVGGWKVRERIRWVYRGRGGWLFLHGLDRVVTPVTSRIDRTRSTNK